MSYSSEVLADSPVGYWRLEETTGATAADSSGNARDGTYTGSPTLGVPGALAISTNKATTFNGTTQYVAISDNAAFSIPTTNLFSVEAWFRTTATGAVRNIVSKVTAANFEWSMFINGAPAINFLVYNAAGGGSNSLQGPASVVANTWYHVVATVNASTNAMILYINGVQVDTNTNTQILANGTSPVNIGRRPDGTSLFNGSVDEVAIYPTVLSAARVAAHYAAAAIEWELPTVLLSYAPGFSPIALPGAFVDLSARLRSFTMKRGRQDETAKFEAGSATFILDGSDGLLDPLESSSLFTLALAPPYTPVRLRITWGGVAYTVFYGFMVDGPRPITDGRSRERLYEVECTDLMGWASSVDSPPSRWGCLVADTAPNVWVTGEASLTPATGADNATIWNQGSNAGDLRFVGGPAGVLNLDTGLVPSESGAALRLSATSPDLARVETPVALPDEATFGVAVWFKTADIAARRFLVSQPFRWYIALNADGTVTAASVNSSGVDVLAVSTVVGDGAHDNNATHLAVANFDRTGGQITLYTDFDASGGVVGPTFGWATGDAVLSVGELLVTGTASPTIDDVVYWRTPPNFTPTETAWQADKLVADTAPVWDGDTLTQRLSHLAGAVRVYTITAQAHSSAAMTFGAIEPPADLASGWQQTAAYVGGAAWVTRTGDLRVRDYKALTDPAYAANYSTTKALLSDVLIDDDTSTVRVSKRSRTGFRQDRIVNQVDISNVGGASGTVPLRSRSFDRGSRATYGLRGQSFASEVSRTSFEDHAPLIGQAIIDRYKVPSLEIGSLVIEPWGNNTATQYVLADLELETSAVYTESVPEGGVLVDARVCVQGESWSWDGTDWTVTLDVSAEEYTADIGTVYGTFTIGDATLGQIGQNRIG